MIVLRRTGLDGIARYPRCSDETFAEIQAEAESEYLALLEKETRDRKESLIDSYFPAKGPYRRELYPKHMQFIAAGGKHKIMPFCPPDCEGKPHRERAIVAANQVGKCLGIKSIIETVEGPKSIEELIDRNKPFEVWSWDGSKPVKALAGIPFKKPGLYDSYRLTFRDRTWIDCATRHRLLASDNEYSMLSELFSIVSFFPEESTGGIFLSEFFVDVSRCLKRALDYLCDLGSHNLLCDEQLHPVTNGGLFSFPSLNAIAEHNPCYRSKGGLGDSGIRTSDLQLCDLRYIYYRLPDYLDQFYGFCSANRISQNSDLRLRDLFLILYRSLLKIAPAQTGGGVFSSVLGTKLSSGSPFLLDTANQIVSVDLIPRQEVYDFEVFKYHNYIAQNLVHHNSDLGAYETTMHLTGDYPKWWPGRRFEHPVLAWAAGDTNQTTRDTIQFKLLGAWGAFGTGMIPKRYLIHTTAKSGMSNAVETIYVRHASGGRSELGLKSYDQGRLSFQGTKKHFIWLDEECPADIYGECLIRTINTDGEIILTFTPLQGLTEVVRGFLGLEPLDKEEDAA